MALICIYPADCTDFSSNGLGALSPQSAEVSETLNGEYELTLVHPLDEAGKWRRLAEGRIIRAPVPAAMTPAVTTTATAATSTEIYRVSTNRDPLRLRSGTGTNYRILGKYKKGTQVVVLSKSNSSWYEVSCPDGRRGYMYASYLTYVRTKTTAAQAAEEVVESRQLREQPFRIYRIVPELDKVTVYARHIFYDLLDNMVRSYKPSASLAGASVVQGLSAACLSEHPFTFYSDLEATAEEVEYENKNPVDCLLGEDGITQKYGGELVRDWYDVFVMQRIGTDTSIQIREGKNLLGIKYDLDLTDVVTRIMPTGQDKDGELLYLPEVFVDSPNLDRYPFPKWIHLDVSEAKEVTSGKEKKTKAQCYAEMRKAAQAEYDKGCDLPDVTLTVDFVNVTDTEEYRPYGFLHNIFLGDAVRVVARRVGVAVSMRMTQYTYDCLKKKYTKMTLGTVADTVEGNVITSRQLPSGIITGSKLAINSVGTGQLQNGAVGSAQIQAAAIELAHIQTAVVDQLAANALTAVTARIHQLYTDQLTAEQLYADLASIAAAQITTANIQSANITWADILQATIGTAQIMDAAITRAKIANAAVNSAKIADASITNAKIDDAAITTAKIALGSITTALINTGAVGTAQIADGSITDAKVVSLNADVISTGTLSVDRLLLRGEGGLIYEINAQAGGLTTQQLTETQYQNALSGTVLVARSVTADKIAAKAITANEIAAGTITAAEINVANLFAAEATISRINAIAGRRYFQSTAPESPNTGDVWIDTTNGNLTKMYDGSAWVDPTAAALKTSYIELLDDHIDIHSGGAVNVEAGGSFNVSSGTVNMRTSEFSLQITDAEDSENVVMEMSADGGGFDNLYVQHIVSNSVVGVHDGPDILTVDPDQTGDGSTARGAGNGEWKTPGTGCDDPMGGRRFKHTL